MTGAPPCIAIVEDDRSVLKALRRLLSACSFEVTAFSSGAEFLNSLRVQVPDCVLLDLQMPYMTGLEVQQALRDGGWRLPAIVITAHDEADARERCLAAGARAYLLKPISEQALLQAIRRAIGRGTEAAGRA
jgi:FixJ family two-component response regulator